MPAPSKAWVVISDGAVDADSPVDQALMTGLRDDLVHLREWLGGSYAAAAAVDHNHDGVNSALVGGSGDSLLKNGGFEDGLTSWTTTAYSGGSVAINTANDLEGTQAIGFTSASTANGGGDALSAEVKVAGGIAYRCSFVYKASVANVSSKVEVVWYNKALSQISVSEIWSSADTSTTAAIRSHVVIAPSTARYARVRLTGGVPGSGTSAGTIYIDAVRFGSAPDRQIHPSDVVINEMQRAFTLINPAASDVHLRSQHVGRCKIKWTINSGLYGTIALKKNGATVTGAASGDNHDCVIGDRFTITCTATNPAGDLEVQTFQLCGDIG